MWLAKILVRLGNYPTQKSDLLTSTSTKVIEQQKSQDLVLESDHCTVPGIESGIRRRVEEFRGPVGQGAELRRFISDRQGLRRGEEREALFRSNFRVCGEQISYKNIRGVRYVNILLGVYLAPAVDKHFRFSNWPKISEQRCTIVGYQNILNFHQNDNLSVMTLF